MVRPGSNVGLVLSEKQMENDECANIHISGRTIFHRWRILIWSRLTSFEFECPSDCRPFSTEVPRPDKQQEVRPSVSERMLQFCIDFA